MYEKNVNTFNDIPLKTFRMIVSVSSKIFFLSGKQKNNNPQTTKREFLSRNHTKSRTKSRKVF